MKVTPVYTVHTQHKFLGDLFGNVKFCSLRGEGRRDWERRLKNGVRMKHMIPVDYIEFFVVVDI